MYVIYSSLYVIQKLSYSLPPFLFLLSLSLSPSLVLSLSQASKGKDKTYQPLNKDQVSNQCTDYYVVMQRSNSIQADQSMRDSPDQSNPTTNQPKTDGSDQSSTESSDQSSAESNTSHLSLLEVHHK